MSRDDARALDMLIAARRARRHLGDATLDDLLASELLQDAIVRQLEIIGEAASRISHSYRDSHAVIPWAAIVGMRNRLAHDYWQVDASEVWRTVAEDIPALIESLASVIPPQ